MKPEIVQRVGDVIGIEVTVNGTARNTVRMWDAITEAVLIVDDCNVVAKRGRERLLEQLPESYRQEAGDLLLGIADETAVRQSVTLKTPATAQPQGATFIPAGTLAVARGDATASESLATPALALQRGILDLVADTVERLGVAGVVPIVKLTFLVLVSRLSDKPVSFAIKGPSAGGKSFTLEQVLRLFPPSAYSDFTGMSERFLIYDQTPLSHRVIVLYEAAALEGNDFFEYVMRSLLSEGRIRYGTVEKSDEGMRSVFLDRPGPTGLIVTTTHAALHPENETRMMSVTVPDTPAQTRTIFHAIACDTRPDVDLDPWHDLQHWLEAGERRVVVPYGQVLADLVPATAVRLRRDFKSLLQLIRAHALLHRATRDHDAAGRIVATLDDYAVVRDLIADLFAEGASLAVKHTVREAVVALAGLLRDKPEGVTVSELAERLDIDKSSAWRRVRDAKLYIVNRETRKGHPAQLFTGDPLPGDQPALPALEAVADGLHEACNRSSAAPDASYEVRLHGCTELRGDTVEPPADQSGAVTGDVQGPESCPRCQNADCVRRDGQLYCPSCEPVAYAVAIVGPRAA